MNYIKQLYIALILIAFTVSVQARSMSEIELVRSVYHQIDFRNNALDFNAFQMAFKGFQKLKNLGKIKNNILSIADFNLSSNKERLWIIDMNSQQLLFNTLVAHGRNSGDEFATAFSNIEGSYQSSLGFYLTENIYQGKHGNSLHLLGLEKNINDAAYSRAIVIHGADYVSQSFIKQYGRLGRSFGCPAVPQEECNTIINTIKGGSCLFIYKSNSDYLTKSTFLN